MKIGKIAAVLLVLALVGTLLGGCGSTKTEAPPKQDADFLMGSWFARTASKDGATVDAYDVFNGYFSLYFTDKGDCTMSIDQDHALVKWELTDDGVTLTGDSTYPITFPDESRKTMVIVINGIDVLMEKYEEEVTETSK